MGKMSVKGWELLWQLLEEHLSLFLCLSYLSVSWSGISSGGRTLSTSPAFLWLELQEKQQFATVTKHILVGKDSAF